MLSLTLVSVPLRGIGSEKLKYRKMDLVQEGFDPVSVPLRGIGSEKLYFVPCFLL